MPPLSEIFPPLCVAMLLICLPSQAEECQPRRPVKSVLKRVRTAVQNRPSITSVIVSRTLGPYARPALLMLAAVGIGVAGWYLARSRVKLLLLLCLLPGFALAGDPAPYYPRRPMSELSPQAKAVYLNRTGDCVQDSIAMNGVQRGDENAAQLLWDTDYGPRQHRGSSPSRVAAYCKQRGLPIYNVTGRTVADIEPFAEWACKTGRYAAIGYFGMHFQYLYGRDYEKNTWRVQNNWPGTFAESYEHTPEQFRRNVAASGPWLVILRGPPAAPNPRYR